MKNFSVRVSDEFPFDVARVGGQPFTKHTPVILSESDLTDEMQASPALRIVEEPSAEPSAEPPAETPKAPAEKKQNKK